MTRDKIVLAISYCVLTVVFGSLVALLYAGWDHPNVRQFTMEQFRVIVGLPTAGLFAFLVVAIFQVQAGNIVIKMFGVEFSGAGGPVIMWIFAFLAIATMIGTLWNGTIPGAALQAQISEHSIPAGNR